MRKLTSVFVGALGVIALYCGVVAVSAGTASAGDPPQCDCVYGALAECKGISCTTNWHHCHGENGEDCSSYLTGMIEN